MKKFLCIFFTLNFVFNTLIDIVFIRCWYPVTVPKYYNPVTSLLISSDDKSGWQGMRTVAQIRRDRGLEIPLNKDSLYKVRNMSILI